jgi:MFS family permease
MYILPQCIISGYDNGFPLYAIVIMIPALLFLGCGHSLTAVISGAICFGLGFGIFDANNMPVLCQFVPSKLRATAYGIMNMTGVFAGALVTSVLGKSMDSGHLACDFILMSGIVGLMLIVQLIVLRPKTADM